jgi:hypothetical protein
MRPTFCTPISAERISAPRTWAARTLDRADLRGASLNRADLSRTQLREADLRGCRIHGALVLGGAPWGGRQEDPVLSMAGDLIVATGGIEFAQLVSTLLYNRSLLGGGAVEDVRLRAALVLGCFPPRRGPAVLDGLRAELRRRGWVPLLAELGGRANEWDVVERALLIARMVQFVVADLTGAPHLARELCSAVPFLPPGVPVQPVLLEGDAADGGTGGWLGRLRADPRVLPPHRYRTAEALIGEAGERVVGPAEAAVLERQGPPPAPPWRDLQDEVFQRFMRELKGQTG